MTRTVNLDAALLDTLTPEERAEIEGADDAERASLTAVGAEKDPRHTAAAGAADDDDKDDDTEDGDDDKDEAGDDDKGDDAAEAAPAAAPAPAATENAAAAADDTAAAPAAAPAPAAEAADEGGPVPPNVYRAAPTYSYQLPEDFEERTASVRTAREALLDRYDGGELTREELRAEQAKLDEQARELASMQNRADVARDMQEQAMQAAKQTAVDLLVTNAAKAEHGGIDYRQDERKFKDLDTFVKMLASDDANNGRPFEWFLNEAHKRVRVLHGLGGSTAPAPAPAPAPAAAPAVDPKKAKADAAARRRTEVPEAADLSAVPGGTDPSDVGGEFADVLELEGEAFEDAIATMARKDPARFARFQQGGHA